jgi:hypothetical protein
VQTAMVHLSPGIEQTPLSSTARSSSFAATASSTPSFGMGRDTHGVELFGCMLQTFPFLCRSLTKLGLSEASDVMLTGCSAGGLATYLHAGGLLPPPCSSRCLCSPPLVPVTPPLALAQTTCTTLCSASPRK